MTVAVQVPALGESIVEGTVGRWLVAEGDFVELDQIIVELTTDKVDVEIPSPTAGRIEKILVAVDDTVEVGTQLATIDADAKADASAAAPAADPAAAPGQAEEPAAPAPASVPAPAPAVASSAPGVTPLARRVAEQEGVDLAGVEGSGARGRITEQDVRSQAADGSAPAPLAAQPSAASESPRTAAPTPAPAPASAPAARRPSSSYGYTLQEGDEVIPMSRLRKLVADHMVYSKRTSPHVGTVAEIDMSEVVRLRSQHKNPFKKTHGFSLTFLPFIVQAVVHALRENPALNASVIEDTIVQKRSINIGIAVEAEKGLVVPVVRDADRLSLSGLAAAIEDLSTRARTRKLSADDLQGGTFTISNPGRQGNLYGFAIINQPQVGILRMGEMVKRPVVRTTGGEDAIVIRSMMHLALSYDHRAVDGAPANSFLFRIRELLEAAEFDL